jgi:hypothetical protein
MGHFQDFLIARKSADPDHFADLSLAVIKLMGPGEYVLEKAGAPEQGHFGLAVQDYTHSTAPNRRFADLVAQRLIKAVLASLPASYSDDELASIAQGGAGDDQRMSAVAIANRIGGVVRRHCHRGIAKRNLRSRAYTPNRRIACAGAARYRCWG